MSKLDELLEMSASHVKDIAALHEEAENYNGPFAATIKQHPKFSQAMDLACKSGMLLTALSGIVRELRPLMSQGGNDGEQQGS